MISKYLNQNTNIPWWHKPNNTNFPTSIKIKKIRNNCRQNNLIIKIKIFELHESFRIII
jgi:hypothetical protein